MLLAEVAKPRHTCTLSEARFIPYSIEELRKGTPFKNAVFGIKRDEKSIAVSWWVSPKRTRSYPYARVYDTLGFDGLKATIIPFVKDEGSRGDRDFIQWDTVCLMSLLDVYVILAFYVKAKASSRKGKITEQRFDNQYLVERIEELMNTKLSAHEWNVHEMDEKLKMIAQKSKEAYIRIQKETGVRLHGLDGIDRRIRVIARNIEDYKRLSRGLSDLAQWREVLTEQPKEDVFISRKEPIILKNLIGGRYAWTVDEKFQVKNVIFLVEKKYSADKKIPSLGDIKDGFLKLIVFNNIAKLTDSEGKEIPKHKACLGLTTDVGLGVCWNFCPFFDRCKMEYCKIFDRQLNLSRKDLTTLKRAFLEGKKNKMIVYYLGKDSKELEDSILEKSLELEIL